MLLLFNLLKLYINDNHQTSGGMNEGNVLFNNDKGGVGKWLSETIILNIINMHISHFRKNYNFGLPDEYNTVASFII